MRGNRDRTINFIRGSVCLALLMLGWCPVSAVFPAQVTAEAGIDRVAIDPMRWSNETRTSHAIAIRSRGPA